MVVREPRFLTKTWYVNGLACRKWLWLAFNDPKRLPQADQGTLFRFDEGRRIGELARTLFPTGTLLPSERPRENLLRSKKLLSKRVPLFEAGFAHPDGECYARADVLVPEAANEWNVVEVKSGSSVKEEYLHDLAFQLHCYRGAGLNIRNCALLLIDTEYVREREVNPARLFHLEDVTEDVARITPTVSPTVQGLLELARAADCPEFGVSETFHKDEAGIHDDDQVWKDHPGSDILELYRGGKRAMEFLRSGIYRIKDIPKGEVLRGKQGIQQAAHTTGRVHVDPKRISSFLADLRYPLHFLDFETFGSGIPPFDGTRPYQQIPFQFSVHIVETPGAAARHRSFLSLEPFDPREAFLRALREAIGPEGSLVAWNQSFEKGVLGALANFLPENQTWVNDANGRFIDLMVPFREFSYYSPAQGGSASLKVVLPAITGHGYEGFAITNGTQASLAYLRAAFGDDGKPAPETELREIRAALERYCGQDTEGMVWIVEKLAELTG
jgi:hypothetical protein